MKLQILGCAGGLAPDRRLSSYLIDDRLLVDAGGADAIGVTQPEALLLTHAHLDHVMHVPMLITSRIEADCGTLEIRALSDTIDRIETSLLSDRVWPDHRERRTARRKRVARVKAIAGKFKILGYDVTPLAMQHEYPCVSFAIRQGQTGVIVGGDTVDSRPLWAFAQAHSWVKAVLIETSFPNDFEALCYRAKHLSPALLADQLAPFDLDHVRIFATHIKPEFMAEVVRDLHATLGDRVHVAHDGEQILV